MRRSLLKALTALSVAAAAVGVSTPALAANGDFLGGCDVTITTPDATACQGYYSGNILNGSPTDIALQQGAIAALPGSFTWDGNWTGLVNAGDVIGSLTNTNQINFGQTLFGETIIGAHFGNIDDNLGNSGNVSVFWLFNFGTTGADYVVLDNIRGFSNAALYTTGSGGGVPEPATWAMMLVGFAGAGMALRRSRRSNAKLLQLA
ncbi:PEPxxWA-CTERM sorting domain-containing protein [Sphingomonas sp. SM33]|uniref:PEPxxWA-CTERM sorting domain-containing protein n=1 Tax=Sphingomonas telluris TaxID=2907998 RepID=A0ABS9VI67_9SPHN|nr:PEPxxWA-CTERM sorting domain-containing protein [Sphingomonas telluris]MCH8614666.1 PEPxxWA-CTERM sorting domain-containing protein [Sphingomonas telluris]